MPRPDQKTLQTPPLDADVAALRAQLASALALAEQRRLERRLLDREIVELRATLEESERQLANVRQTFMYRIGEAIVAARTWRGLRGLPRRLLQLRQAYVEKRRADGGPTGEERVAARLRYVDEAMRLLARDGLDAAKAYLAAIPARFGREQARAMVEVAQAVRVQHPREAAELALAAAATNPAEMRLRALTLNLFEDGQVRIPAKIIDAAPDLFRDRVDAPRRDAILAHLRQLEAPFTPPPPTDSPAGPGIAVVSARYGADDVETRRMGDFLEAARTTCTGTRLWLTMSAPAGAAGDFDLVPATAVAAHPLVIDSYIAEIADQFEGRLLTANAGLVVTSGDDIPLAAGALVAARRAGARFVLDVGVLPGRRDRVVEGWNATERHAAMAGLFSSLVEAADLVIARSPALARQLGQYGSVQPVVIEDLLVPADGRAPEDSAERRRELGLEGRPVVGIMEPLDGDEGLSDAVRALPVMLQHEPGAVLLLSGVGNGVQTLRLLAAQLGVGDRLIIPTGSARSSAFEYLDLCDVVLFPKRRAGGVLEAPVALDAALAAGLPVVAVEGEWAEDRLVNGVSGLLVPGSNVEALGNAVGGLLADRATARRLADGGLAATVERGDRARGLARLAALLTADRARAAA